MVDFAKQIATISKVVAPVLLPPPISQLATIAANSIGSSTSKSIADQIVASVVPTTPKEINAFAQNLLKEGMKNAHNDIKNQNNNEERQS